MGTTELREDNILARVIDSIRIESKAVTIAGVALVVSVLSLLMAWLAVYDAIHAKAEVKEQNAQIERLSDDVDTYRFQISLLHADLKARGFDIPEKEDE